MEICVMNMERTKYALAEVEKLHAPFDSGGVTYVYAGASFQNLPLFLPSVKHIGASRFCWTTPGFDTHGQPPFYEFGGCVANAVYHLPSGSEFTVHSRPGAEASTFRVERDKAVIVAPEAKPFSRLTGEVERVGLIVR